jgi:membrane-bound inhibitor of C-type lysozyme
MVSRQKEQIGELVIALGGVLLTWLTWTSAFNEGSYLVKAAGFGPSAIVFGLALIIFPSYRRERVQKGEKVTPGYSFQIITPRWWAILVIALAAGLINLYVLNGLNPDNVALPEVPKQSVVSSATYKCDGQKTIATTYYTNKVALNLSDGRKLELPQTISGSGARYANADESFVFWNKGNTAFITENNKTTFENCIQTKP